MPSVIDAAVATRLFLVGFMGVGKTTLGRRVASKLELPFVDLDERIEERAGMPVSEIFASEGEDRFRALESEALSALLDEEKDCVVATGGGTFAIERNRERIRTAGVSVWLDVPMEELLERIEGLGRPLWGEPAAVERLASEREPFYRLADVQVELECSGPDEATRKILDAVQPLLRSR